MKRLIFVMFMITCSVSWAEWNFTGRMEDGAVYFHDKSTIRKNGVKRKMWIMVNQTDGSTKALKVYNCNSEEFSIAALTLYSGSMGAGKVGTSISFKENEQSWEPVIPDSIVELEWKIACGKK
jgi:hypothetical protein